MNTANRFLNRHASSYSYHTALQDNNENASHCHYSKILELMFKSWKRKKKKKITYHTMEHSKTCLIGSMDPNTVITHLAEDSRIQVEANLLTGWSDPRKDLCPL